MMRAAEWLFAAGLLAYLAGAVAGLADLEESAARRAGRHSALALAGALLANRRRRAVTAPQRRLSPGTCPSASPLFPWTVRLDPLSAWFNLALGILAAAVSIYSFGYLRPMEGRAQPRRHGLLL